MNYKLNKLSFNDEINRYKKKRTCSEMVSENSKIIATKEEKSNEDNIINNNKKAKEK